MAVAAAIAQSTATLIQIVNKSTPTVTATSSLNPSVFGTSITFSASLTAALADNATGTVQWMDGATPIGSPVPVASAGASMPFSILTAGTHSITAVYGGDLDFSSSTSKALKQIVETPAPYGVVSPTTLNFGQVQVGQTSSPLLVSLENTGESELTISSISLSGDFALPTNHCAAGVKPLTHCNVYVTFTPTGIGTATGTLTFTDNASNSPQTVSLTGTGIN